MFDAEGTERNGILLERGSRVVADRVDGAEVVRVGLLPRDAA